MTSAIDQLTRVTSMNTGDRIPKYDASNADDATISYTNFLTALNAILEPANSRPVFTKQTSTPTAGATIQVTDGSDDIWLLITPAGTLATLTITLPAIANVRDGQEILIYCSQIITTLTIDENGATDLINEPTSLAANQTFTLKYDSTSDTWYNMQAPA
jgi:hypothetical protein